MTDIKVGSHSEEELRTNVLVGVEEALLLEGGISPVCAEHFGSQSIIFSDSILKLKEQLDLANKVLGYFNLIAQKLNFKELKADSIREELGPYKAQKASRWMGLDRVGMFSVLGDEEDCRATYTQYISELYE